MSRYLLLTHRTAFSPELRQKVGQLIAQDSANEFVILVPDLHSQDFTWEGETVDVASQRAEAAKLLLEESLHAKVTRAVGGSSAPLQAIGDGLTTSPDYAASLICTLPPGISRWLHLDLVHQAERKFGLPIIHVVAHSHT